ncbi:unnamed protein product [Miscanthus lutarioriparius]|uniref:Uncharacterized protein n=1 Tax=Miscanthus lutarioriparius TaxID=422564 RepID=A0A811RI10_9POAL|nr:unnamed protein product [Miscanthus lutarioriparius]
MAAARAAGPPWPAVAHRWRGPGVEEWGNGRVRGRGWGPPAPELRRRRRGEHQGGGTLTGRLGSDRSQFHPSTTNGTSHIHTLINGNRHSTAVMVKREEKKTGYLFKEDNREKNWHRNLRTKCQAKPKYCITNLMIESFII